MKLLIENHYSNGHASSSTVELDTEPAVDELDDWFDDEVLPLTGDGTGLDPDLGYCYTATIVEADDATLVGRSNEWVGS